MTGLSTAKRKRDQFDDAETPSEAQKNPAKRANVSRNRPTALDMLKRTEVVEKGTTEVQTSGLTKEGSDAVEKSTNYTIRRLAVPRPFPIVPASESATGPKSAHKAGLNLICITRKTPLGAYLRRCRDVLLKHNYKSLHLHALGAAITHLSLLVASLPATLPYPPGEIHTHIGTDTIDVRDELIPEDEDEDISYQVRGKSAMSVVFWIGDPNARIPDEVLKEAVGSGGPSTKEKKRNRGKRSRKKDKALEETTGAASDDDGSHNVMPVDALVYEEGSQEEE